MLLWEREEMLQSEHHINIIEISIRPGIGGKIFFISFYSIVIIAYDNRNFC